MVAFVGRDPSSAEGGASSRLRRSRENARWSKQQIAVTVAVKRADAARSRRRRHRSPDCRADSGAVRDVAETGALLRDEQAQSISDPNRPAGEEGRDPYVGPDDRVTPKIWYFLLDNRPWPWHERGTAATLPRTVSGSWLAGWVVGRIGARGVGIGGEDESPPFSTRSAAASTGCQVAALPFASSCAMPFSIARIWFTKSSRIAPFCIESGNGTEILSVAVAS
jgi:hypothetical protein